MARDRIKRGRRRIYFCLEGSLKADAVLSHGGAAFSCTSVTTWEADEDLGKVIGYLKRAPEVIVVPDSDYRTNSDVVYQTHRAASWLARAGVRVTIGVPLPIVGLGKTGIDDFLASGFGLDELQIVPHPLPTPAGLRERDRILFEFLAQRGTWGTVRVGEIVEALGWNRKRVYRGFRALERAGLIRYIRPSPRARFDGEKLVGQGSTSAMYEFYLEELGYEPLYQPPVEPRLRPAVNE
jgi:hypothetical protein